MAQEDTLSQEVTIRFPDGRTKTYPAGLSRAAAQEDARRILATVPPGLSGITPDPKGANDAIPIEPKDFVKGLGKTGLSAASLASSFLPVGLPIRMALQGLLGGAQGALDEDSDATSGALSGMALEGLGSAPVEKLIRRAGNSAALWAGLGANKLGDPETIKRGSEAFTRQASRRSPRHPTAIPVGGQRRVENRIKEAGESLEATERGVPTITNFTAEAPGFRAAPRMDPNKMLGSTDPIGTAQAIKKADDTFVEGNEALLQRIRQSNPIGGNNALVKQGQKIPPSSDMTLREMAEIGRAQTREGSKLFTQLADGQWVRTADSPSTQAAATRGLAIKDRAKEVVNDFDPNIGTKRDSLTEELSDLFLMENLNKAMRRGLGFGISRGAGGAALGGILASAGVGDYATNAGTGAAAGFMLSPKMISQLFNTAATGAKLAPFGVRANTLKEDVLELGSSRTKRRDPK